MFVNPPGAAGGIDGALGNQYSLVDNIVRVDSTSEIFLIQEIQDELRSIISVIRARAEKVASLLESLGVISKDLNSNKLRQKSIDKDICNARTCYDHFAGKISVMYTKRLLKNNYIEVNGDQFDITLKGIKYFSELGIDIDILTKKKRNFAKQCLDWTEREYHISGSLGQAILTFLLDNRMLIKSKKKSSKKSK